MTLSRTEFSNNRKLQLGQYILDIHLIKATSFTHGLHGKSKKALELEGGQTYMVHSVLQYQHFGPAYV